MSSKLVDQPEPTEAHIAHYLADAKRIYCSLGPQQEDNERMIAANLAKAASDERARLLANDPALSVPGASRWRHRKRGSTYRLLGVVEVQCDAPVIDAEVLLLYRAENDSSLWVRRRSEFMDGRFERIEENRDG